MVLIFFAIPIFLTQNSYGAIDVGETLNGYTYEDYISGFLVYQLMQETAFASCDGNIYFSRAGSRGWSIEEYDPVSNNITNYYWFYRNQNEPTTNQEEAIHLDCNAGILYTIAEESPTLRLRAYELTSLWAVGNLPLFTFNTDRGNNTGSLLLYNGSQTYGTSMIQIGEEIFISNYEGITGFDNSGDLQKLIELNISETIIDMETDGSGIYVMTNESINRYTTDLVRLATNTDPQVVTQEYPLRPRNKFLFYNSFDGRFHAIIDNETMTAIDKNFLTAKDSIVLNNSDFFVATTGSMNSVFVTGQYMYNADGGKYYKCHLIDGECTSEFFLTNFTNWTGSFSSATQWSKKSKGIIQNGTLYSFAMLDNNVVDFIAVSGFEIAPTFIDSFSIDSININKTPEFINEEVVVTVEAEHVEGNQYLQYAFTCDSSGEILYSVDFDRNADVTNESSFNNPCDYEIVANDFGLSDYVLEIDDCTDGIVYPIENNIIISGKYDFVIEVGQSSDQRLIVQLLSQPPIDTNGTLVADQVISFNVTNTLRIHRTNDNEIIYERVLTPTFETPIHYDNRRVYELSFMADTSEEHQHFRIGTRLYGENNFVYGDDFNITPISVSEATQTYVYDNDDDTSETFTSVSGLNSRMFRINTSEFVGNTPNDILVEGCVELSQQSGTPFIQSFFMYNTTDGLVSLDGESINLTSGLQQEYCFDIPSDNFPITYDDNVTHDYEYFGIRCTNCDASNKYRIYRDTSSNNNNSILATNRTDPSTWSFQTNNYMMNLVIFREFFIENEAEVIPNLYGYNLFGTITDNQEYTQVFDINVIDRYFPHFEVHEEHIEEHTGLDSNQHICTYNKVGSYLVTGYVSSIFDENYNNFISTYVTIVDYEVSDIGNAFDGLFNDSPFSPSFWKNIIFLAFTLIILVGVGFFNGINNFGDLQTTQRPLGLMWLEFIGSMTFMLFIMSYYLGFFPLFYFISIIIIDSLTITYYIGKVFGGSE